MKEKGIKIDVQINGAIIRALEVESNDISLSNWTGFYKSLKVVDDGKDEIVKGVTEIILEADWSEEVESKLKKFKLPLSGNILSRIICQLKYEPLKALKFFEWVASYLKYEHNGITYSEMARVLVWGGFMDEFWDLVMQMRKKGCEIDNDSYVKIIKRVGNVEAVKWFEFMMDGPYKLPEQECVRLLKILAHEHDPDMDLVMRVLNKYLEAGNSYTKGIYIVKHKILCKLGRFDEARKIVEDMKKAGHKPDNIIYSQEVYGLCKCNRFEDARNVFNQMEAEECTPDMKTWNVLIQRYCSAGQIRQALSCFAEMLGKNISPDGDILEVLINGFLAHKKLLGAYDFLVDMVNKYHLKPWQTTCKLMIEMLLIDGKLEEAFNLLSMMKQHNYRPYPEPFVAYISKHGTVMDANRFLRALPKKGLPSTAAYVKVISSFVEEGRHSEARDLFDSCPHHLDKEKKIQEMFGMTQNNSPS